MRFSSAAGLALAVAPLIAQEITGLDEGIAAQVPQKETGDEYDHLTGDWIGIRPILVDLGIHFQAGYAGEVFGNLSGGNRQGAVYTGLFEMALELDTERLSLWNGGFFRVSSLTPHGRSLSENYTGDLLTLSNIDAYDSARLYELWYEHSFWDDKLSLRAGQVTADDEFATGEVPALFINSGFGWPAFISGNIPNGGPAYFAAAPGLMLKMEPADWVFLQAGIYDGDPFDSRQGDPRVNASGTRIHLSSRQGFFTMGEVGFRQNQGLPGEYRLGIWLHSGDFPSNSRDTFGNRWAISGLPPATHEQNYGYYISGEQMLWSEEDQQGLSMFARVGSSPSDRSQFEMVADGGVVYRGLFPGRDEDVFGIGAVHARISRDIRRSEQLDAAVNATPYPAGYSDHETVVECFYSVKLKEWWSLQPDLQWIINPGGGDEAPDAFVVGIRTTIVF